MDTDSNSKTVMKNKKMRNSTQRMSFLYKKMFKEGFFAHTQSCHEKKQKQKKNSHLYFLLKACYQMKFQKNLMNRFHLKGKKYYITTNPYSLCNSCTNVFCNKHCIENLAISVTFCNKIVAFFLKSVIINEI